jgi:hypothetical protein
MCEPASIGLALSIASAGAGFVASQAEADARNSKIDSDNKARIASDMRARVSANEEREDLEDQARIENQRLLEDAFENELASRATAAELLVSASGAGLNLAGSVVEAFDELNAAGFRSEQNALEEMAQVGDQLEANKRRLKAKEASRIEDNRLMPFVSGPSPLGTALEIGASVNTFAEKKGGFKKEFGLGSTRSSRTPNPHIR